MSGRLPRVLFSLVLAVCVQGAARGEKSDEQRARMHYQAGKTLYGLGNYPDALRELLLGYAAVAKPQFLLNIGQCYRKLGEPAKAKEMYEKYLRDAPPDDRERPQVQAVLRELEKQLAEKQPAPTPAKPPPETAPPPTTTAPPPEPPATTAASPAPVADLLVEKPPPPKPKRRAWWAIPVAVVAAAGLSVGLYFALRPTCSASIGCLSAGGN